ncbi:MAG: hypothetical protein ACJ0DD_00720 [Paracoccaceae bacterium]
MFLNGICYLFYAILRAFTAEVWVVQFATFISGGIITAKLFGVIAMFGAIVVMALAPWLDTSSVRSGRYRPQFKWWFAILVVDFIVLMWCGAMPAEEPYANYCINRICILVCILFNNFTYSWNY